MYTRKFEVYTEEAFSRKAHMSEPGFFLLANCATNAALGYVQITDEKQQRVAGGAPIRLYIRDRETEVLSDLRIGGEMIPRAPGSSELVASYFVIPATSSEELFDSALYDEAV